MITPMRHITLICRVEDTSEVLESVRDFGELHLVNTANSSHDLEERTEALTRVRGVLQKLQTIEQAQGEAPNGSIEELVQRCRRILESGKELQNLDQKLAREEHIWAPFGSIRKDTLRHLSKAGLDVKFLRAAEKPADAPEEAIWLPAETGFGVLISPVETKVEGSIALPVRGPAVLTTHRATIARIQNAQQEALSALATRIGEVEAYAQELEEELEFRKAHQGMEADEHLAWIQGFVPAEKLPEIENRIQEWGAGLFSREPTEEDATPTLLKHNAFVSWIQPVFSFLGVTPGYNEVDVGWSFLVFLSVFSGMIIGDAGYGILLLGTVAVLNLMKPGSRGGFSNLLYLTGACTVLWGGLSGNYFGVVVPFRIESLSVDSTVMNLCFLLGTFHLSIAHGWTLLRKRTSLQALAEAGWIGTSWTMYFLIADMVVGQPKPGFTIPLGILSVTLIILFMTPKERLKEDIMQHMMLPMTLINNFVDVISYVRLYAVGMATLAMASSFNDLTMGGAEGRNLVLTLLMVIVLVFGHALNCVLAGLGIIVHGVRLNTLEFSSHIGLTWSGIPYSPFRKHTMEPQSGLPN